LIAKVPKTNILFAEEEPIFPEVFELSVIYVKDLSPLLVDKSYMTSTNFTGLVVLTPTIAPPAPYARILQYRGAAALIFGYELLGTLSKLKLINVIGISTTSFYINLSAIRPTVY
jgi:hypothetical protein